MIRILKAALLAAVLVLVACQGDTTRSGYLEGIVEDLWNSKINLAKYNKGVTILQPYSPSNCGWCFFDGDFIRENYYRNAVERGDAFFGMCLFNSQRDIYTFQKHYREDATVITGPLSLHRKYHENGFPWVTIVKDGKRLFQDIMTPYDFLFDSLSPLMWPDDPPPVRPSSPLHLATKFTKENEHMNGIEVIPDNDSAGMRDAEEWRQQVKQRYVDHGWEYHESFETKYESDLREVDLTKNIELTDKEGRLRFDILDNQAVPVRISDESVSIGEFAFPRADVFVAACFPNPYDPEKFVIVTCAGRNVRQHGYMNHVDYYVSRNTAEGELEILLYGHFDKSGENWKFDSRRAVMSPSVKKFCSDRQCPLPIDVTKTRYQTAKKRKQPGVVTTSTPYGKLFTVGGNACRLPSVAVDDEGICWVAWEEDGDILLSSVNIEGEQESYFVESDSSDSFDPVIAATGKDIWVFYLNDIERYYRLYGRYLSSGRLSAEVPLSEWTVCDAITPAVVSDETGKLAIAWSEWRANSKYLKYRIIENRVPGEVKAIQHKAAESEPGYVCAWSPALAMDKAGDVRGAWNQHYPAVFAVYSGDLDAVAIEIGEGDVGGYPAVAFDKGNTFWVFWETFLWERAYGDNPQRVQAVYYNEEENRFSVPATLSDETQTVYNQTPCVAVSPEGAMWVAWSGRDDEGTPWGIYLVKRDKDYWSEPVMVSPVSKHARAPSIAVSDDGVAWLAWHAGSGDDMKVEILRYEWSSK